MTIPIHKDWGNKPKSSGTKLKSSGTKPESSETKPDSSETKSESSGTSLSSSEESIETVGFGSEKSTGSSEKTSNSSEKTSNSSEKILERIKQNPKISAAGIAMEIGISSRGVEKQIKKLREAGIKGKVVHTHAKSCHFILQFRAFVLTLQKEIT